MVKPEWGTKRTCPECGTRFYDLGSSPVQCVSCETAFEPLVLLKSRRVKPEEVKKQPVAAPPTPEQPDSELAALKAEGVDVDDADDFDEEDNIESLDSLDEDVAAPETMVDAPTSKDDN